MVHSPTLIQDYTFTDLVIYSENISNINSNVYGVDIIWEGPCKQDNKYCIDRIFKKGSYFFQFQAETDQSNLTNDKVDVVVSELLRMIKK